MLGRSHTISGIAAASLILTFTQVGTNGPTRAATAIALIAGSAILPDIDHPGATISRSIPPVSQAISRVVSRLAGGHRKGTHSILGWNVFGILAGFTSLWHLTIPAFTVIAFDVPSIVVAPGLGIIAGFLAGIALAALHLDPGGVPGWIIALLMVGVGSISGLSPILAGVLVSVGCMVHAVFGDGLTTQGVPYLYPFIKTNFRFPVLGKTGSQKETIYVVILGVFAIMVPLIQPVIIPWIQGL